MEHSVFRWNKTTIVPAIAMLLNFKHFSNLQLQSLSFFNGRILYSTTTTTSSSSSSSSSSTEQSLQTILSDYLGFPNSKPSSSSSNKLLQFLQLQASKKVSHADFAKNVDSIVTLLEQLGFQQSQIKKVVSYDFRILSANVEKTLKPKIQLLQDLGFSGSDLVRIVVANPFTLHRRLGPTIHALREVFGSDDDVIRVLKRPNSIYYVTGNYLVPNVKLLQSYGICGDRIRSSIVQTPRIFARKTEMFRELLARVEHEFGIPRGSASFLACVHLASFKEDSRESKYDLFKRFGWTHSDILTLIRQNPHCLGLSEVKIAKKLEFLMKELGYEPAYLASRSVLVGLSLENRIVPRHKMLLFLKEKGLMTHDYSFFTVVCWSEPKFVKMFIEPFKEVVPDIYQIYLRTKDAAPRAKSL